VDFLHGEGRQFELIAMEIEVFGFFRGHCCWSHGVVIEREEEGRRTLRLYHGCKYRIRGRSIYFFSQPFSGHGPRPDSRGLTSLVDTVPTGQGLKLTLHIWPPGALARAVCRIAGMAGSNEVFAAGAADRCAASHSHVNFGFAVEDEDSCAKAVLPSQYA
jgi:hypothetical protein